MPDDVLEEAIGRGATVVQTYGLTETASQVTTLAPADAQRKLGSAGRPLLTTHLRIKDGEILVQGPTVAPGCRRRGRLAAHRRPRAGSTKRASSTSTGRLGDVIVTGGENVLPAEVEEVLLRHPEVADAAVVGRADREWQEAVAAVVVRERRPAPSADELRRHCACRLAGYKVPKRFEFAAELPRTRSGKLMRERCGERVDRRRRSQRWLDAYVAAWKSYDREAIAALFTEDVDVPLPPLRRADPRPRCDRRIVVRRRGKRPEPRARRAPTTPLRARRDRRRPRRGRRDAAPTMRARPIGVYDNCWLIRFDDRGRCREFTEWFMERPATSIPRHA